MSDSVERLTPTSSTIRKLYLFSGNRCAFPGCTNNIVDEDGTYVGKICHIVGAEKGGPRFNASMTNEDRRSYDNLILLCANHHEKIDQDASTYTVDKLIEMKKNHEKKYNHFLNDLECDLEEKSGCVKNTDVKEAESFLKYLTPELTEDEKEYQIDVIKSVKRKLLTISRETRKVFAYIIKYSDDRMRTNLDKVEKMLEIPSKQLSSNVFILDEENFIILDTESYKFPLAIINEGTDGVGWPIYEDLKNYCDYKGFDIVDMIYELDFSLLE